MDQPHLATHLAHLESLHEQHQAQMAQFQQQLAQQAETIREQAQTIQTLRVELVSTHSQLNRMSQLEEQLARLKSDVSVALQAREGRHQREPTPVQPAISTEQLAQQATLIRDMRRELDDIQRADQQLSLSRTEMSRLSTVVDTFEAELHKLRRELEEKIRPLAFIDEQRRANMQRITELELELPKLRKQLEDGRAKVVLLEQRIPPFGQYDTALDQLRTEVRQYREKATLQTQAQDRDAQRWTDLVQAHEDKLTEYTSLIEKYQEHYHLNQRALASLQEFQERIQREQHHAIELQRLTEERQWAAIEKWKTDYEQRWQRQRIEWKPEVAELDKSLADITKQLRAFVEMHQALEQQVDLVLQILEEDIQTRTQAGLDWQSRFEQIVLDSQQRPNKFKES